MRHQFVEAQSGASGRSSVEEEEEETDPRQLAHDALDRVWLGARKRRLPISRVTPDMAGWLSPCHPARYPASE